MLTIHQVEVQPNLLWKTQENDWQTYNTALENSAGGKVEDQKVRKQKMILIISLPQEKKVEKKWQRATCESAAKLNRAWQV